MMEKFKEEKYFFKQKLQELNFSLPISDEILNLYISKWERKSYAAKSIICPSGEIADHIWFIVKGGLKGIRNVEGVDWTYMIGIDGDFMGDYVSFLKREPSSISFYAITDVIVYSISFQDLQQLYSQEPLINDVASILGGYACKIVSERIVGLQTQNLKERYRTFVESNPLMLQIIPQQDIASYLGVTPQSLSRLKGNLSSENEQLQ